MLEFDVFAVLPGTSAWDALRRFAQHHPLHGYRPEVAGPAAGDPVPVDLTVVAVELASQRWRAVLPADVANYLNFAVLHRAPVLMLHDVPEAALSEIGNAADANLMPTEPPLWVPYLPARKRPLVFAVPARAADEPVDRSSGQPGGHLDRATAVAFSPDGARLATVGAHTVKIWDIASGACTATGLVWWVDRIRFAPDGRTLLVSSFGYGEGVVIDTVSGAEVAAVPSEDAWFSPDGSYLAAVDHSADAHTVRVDGAVGGGIDHGGDVVRVLDLRHGVEVLAVPGNFASFAPDGQELVVSDPLSREQEMRGDTGTCTVYRSVRGEVVNRLPGRFATFGPDGSVLTLVDDGAAVSDATSGQRLNWLPLEGALGVPLSVGDRPIEFTGDGDVVVIKDHWDSYGLWHAQSGRHLFSVRTSRVVDVPRSPLVVGIDVRGSEGFAAAAFDTRTGQERYRLDADEVRAQPGGQLLATTKDAFIVTGDGPSVNDRRTSVVQASHGEPAFEVAGVEPLFSPDGRLLVTLRDDSRIELWDAGTGEHIKSLGNVRVLSRASDGLGGGMGPGDGDPVVAPVSRYVEMVAPATVSAGDLFTITVQLLRRAPQDLPDAAAIQITPTVDADGNPTGAQPVLAVVYASDAFETTGPARASIPVPSDADSPVVEFSLRARDGASGPYVVNVVLWQGFVVLGQATVVINIGAVTGRRELRRSTVAVAPPPEPSPPDVIITVNRTTFQGRDTLHYSYSWRSEQWPVTDAGEVQLRGSASEWLADQFATLSAAAVGSVGGPVSQRDIEVIGENLFRELFTPQLAAFYRRFAPTARSVLLYSNEPWIPWELVRPWSADSDEGDDFLCARFDFSRWYYSDAGRSPRPDLSVGRVGQVVPATNLIAAVREGRYLDDLPARWPPVALSLPAPVRASDVLALMGAGRTHLFHFATHGVTPADRDGPAVIRLDEGELKTEELVGSHVAHGLAAAAPMVFINACHSGHQAVALVRDDGWVQRLLDLGCTAFIGANWVVDDDLAADFAIAVYDQLVQGATVASAVRQARAQLRRRNPDNSTWLAYSLYAHPHLVLRPAARATGAE